MTGRAFFDTNIIVYSRDASEPQKMQVAKDLLQRHWSEATARLSCQVLAEFYQTVTQKLKPGLRPQEAAQVVRLLMTLEPLPTDSRLIDEGLKAHQSCRLSWWDALIVAAAAIQECDTLYSEDMQHTATHLGVRIVNPFR